MFSTVCLLYIASGDQAWKTSKQPSMRTPHGALLLLFILACLRGAYSGGGRSRFTSIISFGDSYADTGNLVMWADPVLPGLPLKNLPYGETFFGHPTGRATDGRLVLDFIGNHKCTAKFSQLLSTTTSQSLLILTKRNFILQPMLWVCLPCRRTSQRRTTSPPE